MSDIISEGWPISRSVCGDCKHYHFEGPYFSCTAFEKIPDEILEGKNKHDVPLKGQKNDIVFEQIKK